MIAVQDICARAGNFMLHEVSFAVPKGAYAVLMGPTGCGKTTLLEVICGLHLPTSGTVHLLGHDVTFEKPANRGIGYIPQDAALFSHLTVRENLAFALHLRKWSYSEICTRVEELAAILQITHLLQRKPRGLSGGETQRVALGRALAFRPQILCLDEPLSALDHDTRLSMCDMLELIKRDLGVTFLHVTHDKSEAERLADFVIRMDKGRVLSTD